MCHEIIGHLGSNNIAPKEQVGFTHCKVASNQQLNYYLEAIIKNKVLVIYFLK